MTNSYDVLIRGAEVYDGTGSSATHADVGVSGDRIAAVGSLDASSAALEIDAKGMALAPGFIDVHTHDDFAALTHPDMGFKSRGGVTTCVVGNCGFGAAPFPQAAQMLGALAPGNEVAPYDGHAGYAARLEAAPPGINIGVLAGHGTLRMAVLGSEDRAPSDREFAQMKSLLEEALDAGVLGMSSGLIYDPGRYAQTEELVELATVMRGSGALYATHMRDEGVGLLDSVQEAIEIGRQGGVPVQISHHKASGRDSWGLVEKSLELIEAAQARGESVHADQYPYTAGSTMLRAVLENGAFLVDSAGGVGNVSPDDVVVAFAPGREQWDGRTIADLSAEFGMPARETALKIVEQAPGTTSVMHMMNEDDVQRVMRHPSTLIGSDGIPTLDGGKPHPRLYNTFARVLGHYSRDLNLFDLATAVHRMTGLAAEKFGLNGRGVIAEDAFADLVLFDAQKIIDKGTFEDPNQYPIGISHVFVNGALAVHNDKVQGNNAGRVLRRV